MPRDDAQKRVADKIADACGDPDKRYAGMGDMSYPPMFCEPEHLSPLDRSTRDEEATQRFYESKRHDDSNDGE